MNRRGFLGSLLAVATAPLVAPEASASWLRRFLINPLKKIRISHKGKSFELEGVGVVDNLSPEMKRVNEIMKKFTQDAIKQMSEQAYTDGEKWKAFKDGRIKFDGGQFMKSPVNYSSITTDIKQPPSV